MSYLRYLCWLRRVVSNLTSTGIDLRSISEHSIMEISRRIYICTDNLHTRTHMNFLTHSIHSLK